MKDVERFAFCVSVLPAHHYRIYIELLFSIILCIPVKPSIMLSSMSLSSTIGVTIHGRNPHMTLHHHILQRDRTPVVHYEKKRAECFGEPMRLWHPGRKIWREKGRSEKSGRKTKREGRGVPLPCCQ